MLLNDIKQRLVTSIESDVSIINLDDNKIDNLDIIYDNIATLEAEKDLTSYIDSMSILYVSIETYDNYDKMGTRVLGLPALEADESIGEKIINFFKNLLELIKKGFSKLFSFFTNAVKALFGLKKDIKDKINKLRKLAIKYQKEGRVNLAGEFPKHIKETLYNMFKITLLYEDELTGKSIIDFVSLQKIVIRHDVDYFMNVVSKNVMRELSKINDEINKSNLNNAKSLKKIKNDVEKSYKIIIDSFKDFIKGDPELARIVKASEFMFGGCETYVKTKACFYDLAGLQTNNVRLLNIHQVTTNGNVSLDIKPVSINNILSTSNKANTELKKMYKNISKTKIKPLEIEEILTFLDLWENTLEGIDPAINMVEGQIDNFKKDLDKMTHTLDNTINDIKEIDKDIAKEVYNVLVNFINYIRRVVLNSVVHYSSGLYSTIKSVYSDYYITYADLSMKLMTK